MVSLGHQGCRELQPSPGTSPDRCDSWPGVAQGEARAQGPGPGPVPGGAGRGRDASRPGMGFQAPVPEADPRGPREWGEGEAERPCAGKDSLDGEGSAPRLGRGGSRSPAGE